MFEDEILLEHFDVPDTFNVTITVSCEDNLNVICTAIDNETEMGSAIDATYSRYGSKIGTIVDCIIANLENVLKVR